jgi:hypothetical protein
VLGLLLWKLPISESQIQEIKDPKDRLMAQNELYKTFIQLAGGSLLMIGFFFTWKTIRVTQEGQITDRFNKAVDHLGQEGLSVRLGGIYALARIAADSAKDSPTITEIFTAYIREATSASKLETPATDVKSMMVLLGTSGWAKENVKDLSRCILRGLDLRDADLRNTILSDADLTDANLQGTRLDGNVLLGTVLRGAYLRKCSLRAANLTAADLTGATLRDANLQSAKILGATLKDATLFGTNFQDATGAVRQQFDVAVYDESTRLPDFRTDLE